jgi:hypothetical protein
MNPADTKSRPDSKLKPLPEERQDEIAQFALEHSLDQTVHWLAESGLETSRPALSRFLSWYRLRQQMDRSEASIRELLSDLAQEDPTLTPERLHQLGNTFFAGLALEQQDPAAWYMAQKISLRRAQLQLESQKHLDSLKAKKEAIERELETAKELGGLTPGTVQKIEKELNLC